MKHIEVSKKIVLERKASPEDFKSALVGCLERSLNIESITPEITDFKIRATTGTSSGIARHARLDLNVAISLEEKEGIARIFISGYAKSARSLVLFYSFAFFLLLVVGLLPGFYETSQEDSGAVDALFFLIFGIFIVFDVNNKLSTAKTYLETALHSLDTMFG